jgi:hypothetical protein
MAELKTGTTIGGTLVWTQGNFPLYPTGNTLLYKSYMIYSEFNKPQAVDNDFVSKANGGTYGAALNAKSLGITNTVGNGQGLSLHNGATVGEPNNGIHFSKTAGPAGGKHSYDNITSDWATYFKHDAAYPWNFKVGNNVVAYVSGNGTIVGSQMVSMLGAINPEHLTRKDYVDSLINTTTNNANSRVLKAGDTMTGTLVTPAVELKAEAANPLHAARLSQVIVKGTVLDYGEF